MTPEGLHQFLYSPHRTAASTLDTHGANVSAVLLFTLFDLWLLGLPHPHAYDLPALYSGQGSPGGSR